MLYTSSPQTVTPTGNTTVSFKYWRSITGISIIQYGSSESAVPSSALYAVQGDIIQVSEVASSISSCVKLGYYVLTGNEYMTTTGDIYFWSHYYYENGSHCNYNSSTLFIFPIYIGTTGKSKYLGTATVTSASSTMVVSSFSIGSVDSASLGDVFYLEMSDGNAGTDTSGYKHTFPSGYYVFTMISKNVYSGSGAQGLIYSNSSVVSSASSFKTKNGTTYTTVTKSSGVYYKYTFVPYRSHDCYVMYLGTTKPTWCE